jgi:hypothetical protein
MIADMSLRPRIRLRWYVLGVVAGMTATFFTYWWFDGPRWRDSNKGHGNSPHFNIDGSTLTTFHGFDRQPSQPFAPIMVDWDVRSGHKLREIPLSWNGRTPGPPDLHVVQALPGDERILLGMMVFTGKNQIFQYFVHRADDGRKLAGPFESDHWVMSYSNDGHWCRTSRDNHKGLAIIDTGTAETVLRLSPLADCYPWATAFSPDGRFVAVHWRPEAKGARHVVAIYELPSGHEVRRFDLPARPWQRINDWESDNRLYAEIDEPDSGGPGFYFRRSFSFSMSDADFGAERPEPLRAGHVAGTGRQTYWDAGDGWVAHVTTLLSDQGPPLRKATEWIDRKFRTSLTPKWNSSVRIRMLDAADGSVRCEVPQAAMGCTISHDGRWIASAGDAVEVWSVPPPRQAFWATCAGLATFAVALIVGRFRTRAPSNSPGQLPTPAA